jgi:hypothetical protein
MEDITRDQDQIDIQRDHPVERGAEGMRDIPFPRIQPPRRQPVVRPVTEMQVGEMRQDHTYSAILVMTTR